MDRGYQILCNSIAKLSLSTAMMRNGNIGRAIGRAILTVSNNY